MYTWNPQTPEEDVRSPGDEVTGIFAFVFKSVYYVT